MLHCWQAARVAPPASSGSQGRGVFVGQVWWERCRLSLGLARDGGYSWSI